VTDSPSAHGGLVGWNMAGTITASFFDTQTTGQTDGTGYASSTGVTGKTTAEMQTPLPNIFTGAGWDFTATWCMPPASYPKLAWQTTACAAVPAILTVTVSGTYTYTGSPQTPAANVRVTAGGTTLTAGTDYTLSYANNTHAGTATVTATGTGGYLGATGSGTFTIAPADLSTATVTLAGGPYIYTGSQIAPAITSVTVPGVSPDPATPGDYTVSYGTNINAGTGAGSVTMTAVTGGNFTGTKTVNFTIAQAAPTLTLTANPPGGLTTLPGTVTLTATLTGPDVAGKTITFSVNGVVQGTRTTDTSGKATFDYAPPAEGTYSFGAAFAGDANRSAAEAVISLYVVGPASASAVPVPTLGQWALALLALLLAGLALRRRV